VGDRSILFAPPMVDAILAGTKTQTRRIVKGLPPDPQNVRMCAHYLKCDAPPEDGAVSRRIPCPYGWCEDRLWVREAHWYRDAEPVAFVGGALRFHPDSLAGAACPEGVAVAPGLTDEQMRAAGWRKRPGIHMHRWASRITLEITMVRAQRVQSISEDDARAEGVPVLEYPWGRAYGGALTGDGVNRVPMSCARDAFMDLWRKIHGDAGWDANPWVWCITFKRVEAPRG
jgi:hypothetical protein